MGKARIVRNEISLDQIKRQAYDYLNERYNQRICAGFQSQVVLASTGKAHFYTADEKDQSRFTGTMVTLIGRPDIKHIDWKAQDLGAMVPHTRGEFMQILGEVYNHVQGNAAMCVEKKALLKDLMDVREIRDLAGL